MDNLHCQAKRFNRNSNHNRKTPITRSKDFFIVNLVTKQLDSDNKLNNVNANELNSFITTSCSNFDINDVYKNHTHLPNNYLFNMCS